MTYEVMISAIRAYLDEQRTVVAASPVNPGHRSVHRTRVALRRYRSVLRVFADVFDARRVAALDAELVWLSGLLGAVRDVHVMRHHLAGAMESVDAQEPDVAALRKRVERTLGEREKDARRTLTRAMKSHRLKSLRDELDAWSASPPLADSPALHRDLPGYLDAAASQAAKRLRKARKLAAVDPERDAALHRARKAAKRARYTAELGAPALGKPARKAAKRWRRVQDELGQHQDGAIAADFLRDLVENRSDFALGVLWAAERRR